MGVQLTTEDYSWADSTSGRPTVMWLYMNWGYNWYNQIDTDVDEDEHVMPPFGKLSFSNRRLHHGH